MSSRSTLFTLVADVTSAGLLACSSPSTPAPPANSAPALTAASPAATSALVEDLIKDWEEQKALLVKLAEAMPADKFGFKPTEPQRSFGEQIMHIAIGNVELMKLLGTTATPPFTPESAAKLTSKDDVVKALSDAYDFGTVVLKQQTPESIILLLDKDTTFFGASTRARLVWTLLAHAMDIYGQMVVYVRLNGIVPPASRGI